MDIADFSRNSGVPGHVVVHRTEIESTRTETDDDDQQNVYRPQLQNSQPNQPSILPRPSAIISR